MPGSLSRDVRLLIFGWECPLLKQIVIIYITKVMQCIDQITLLSKSFQGQFNQIWLFHEPQVGLHRLTDLSSAVTRLGRSSFQAWRWRQCVHPKRRQHDPLERRISRNIFRNDACTEVPPQRFVQVAKRIATRFPKTTVHREKTCWHLRFLIHCIKIKDFPNGGLLAQCFRELNWIDECPEQAKASFPLFVSLFFKSHTKNA